MCPTVALLDLVSILQVPSMPGKHWTDDSGWVMSNCISSQIVSYLQSAVAGANFISLSCDEVTAKDSCGFLGIHLYRMNNWRREPMFLDLPQVLQNCDAAYVSELAHTSMIAVAAMSPIAIQSKLVCCACDGASVMQGSHSGFITRMITNHAPYCLPMHCMSHRTNLVAGVMDKNPLVCKVKTVVHSAYNYYARSVARRNQYNEHAKQLGLPNHKLMRDCETRFISLACPMERLLQQYPVVVQHLSRDRMVEAVADGVYNQLLEMDALLGCAILLPLMEELRAINKLSQSRYCAYALFNV